MRRNTINVEWAIELYANFMNWRLVALLMRRPNGQKFSADAIASAVRRYDRGLS